MQLDTVADFVSPFPDKFGIPRQSGLVEALPGRIVFRPAYRNADALDGLEGFERIWLIWGFSANRDSGASWKAKVRPPRLGGNSSRGVFATRSPYRPNPLGLSCVRVSKIITEGPGAPSIEVLGADLMDGTPIYDIKPYIPYADAFPDAAAGFTDTVAWKELEVVFPEPLRKEYDDCRTPDSPDSETLCRVLALDPRPHYQDDPDKEYGMAFGSADIRFKVASGILTVTGIDPLTKTRRNDKKKP